jgi:peptidoglycan/xylan/chitin deacetylase (PgdA/CDA1 family)
MIRRPNLLTRRLFKGSVPHDPLVLMYHFVVPGQGTPTWQWAVSMAQFIEQLDLLQTQGWTSASLAELLSVRSLPDKTVAITFDDGYADNYAAFEELAKRCMWATWFMVTRDIGQMSGWTDEVPPQPILSADQLSIMQAAVMEIGSHTVSHCRLQKASATTITKELVHSRQELEQILSQPVTSFAYPYGQFNDVTVTAAREAGYQAACTTRAGLVLRDGDQLRIHRIRIFAGDTLSTFARKLVFADNDVSWSHLAKYYAGRLTNRLHLF